MRNPTGENFLVQALDQRIRVIVEEVLSTLLTQQAQGARGAAAERSGRTVTNHLPVRTGRRGRPRKDEAQVEGKVVKTQSTPQGTIIYTDRDKYLRRANGSVIRVSRVKGSVEPVRAMGYSSSQYQLARRHKWPMPCPIDFEPPARSRRGRRAKASK